MVDLHIETDVAPLERPGLERPDAWTAWPSTIRDWFKRNANRPLSLWARYAILSSVVMVHGMLLLGFWVQHRIERAVVQHAASTLAYQMEVLLEPVTWDLTIGRQISQPSISAIGNVVSQGPPRSNVAAVKIWRRDRTLAYDTMAGGIQARDNADGAPDELYTALRGDVTFAYGDKERSHLQTMEAMLAVPLFEIYAPLRATGSSEVVAIAEFYQNAEALQADISQAKMQTWLVVGTTGLAMFAVLFAVVFRGSTLIDEQREELINQVATQRRLSEESRILHAKLQQANRQGAELNERFLQRIGSDLHDGPAQHLALAMLKMDEIANLVRNEPKSDPDHAKECLEMVRLATAEAMKEIRNISTGVALPELKNRSPSETLLIAVRSHERATGSKVAVSMTPMPPQLPLPVTICLFRFAQEGLNNAFRHAGGRGQSLTATYDGEHLEVRVSDQGPGFEPDDQVGHAGRLGLNGLRQRIEAIGGTFELRSALDKGTTVIARFDNPARQVRD